MRPHQLALASVRPYFAYAAESLDQSIVSLVASRIWAAVFAAVALRPVTP